jgi:hypothetical protein
MINIIKMIVKSTFASIRWGVLSEEDEQLVWDSSLDKILKASYIRRTPKSPHNIVTLDR